MTNCFTFTRVNNNNIDYTNNQNKNIDTYLTENNITITKHINIEINIPNEERNILDLLRTIDKNSTMIVYSLSSFGRTIETILEIIKFLLENQVRIISIKENYDLLHSEDALTNVILNVISMTVKLEKDLMSLRTKEALKAKKLQGISLGKPKGTIQKSKFDSQRDKIEELLGVGLSVRKISKLLGYPNHIGLNNYVKKRNIREKSKKNYLELDT